MNDGGNIVTKLLTRVAFVALLAVTPAWAQGTGSEAAPPAPQTGPTKASLAVMPFTFSAAVLEQKGDDVQVVLKQFETSALTNKFITALVNTRKFDVVERSRIDTILAEHQMTQSGLMDTARAVQAGKMIGADFMLMGEVTVFAITVTWRPIPNTSKWSREVTSQIIVDMRIVETKTSKIVSADKGEARQQSRSLHDQQIVTEIPVDAIDHLQRDLCDQLTIKTIDGVYPIRVIGFSGGVVSLNRGQGGGLEVGQVLEVFSEGQEMLDPDTGDSLGFEEIKIGTVRVSEVLPRFSKAVPVGDMQAVPNGAVCRKSAPAPAPAAPDQPRRGPKW
jgi:curli biogenesis system outer membrane secretion channel CsgG